MPHLCVPGCGAVVPVGAPDIHGVGMYAKLLLSHTHITTGHHLLITDHRITVDAGHHMHITLTGDHTHITMSHTHIIMSHTQITANPTTDHTPIIITLDGITSWMDFFFCFS
jgi:hypothetical protein